MHSIIIFVLATFLVITSIKIVPIKRKHVSNEKHSNPPPQPQPIVLWEFLKTFEEEMFWIHAKHFIYKVFVNKEKQEITVCRFGYFPDDPLEEIVLKLNDTFPENPIVKGLLDTLRTANLSDIHTPKNPF